MGDKAWMGDIYICPSCGEEMFRTHHICPSCLERVAVPVKLGPKLMARIRW